MNVEDSLRSNLNRRENANADTEFDNRLFNLRRLALTSLTSLTIVLNECKIYGSDGYEIRLPSWVKWEKVVSDQFPDNSSEECAEDLSITPVGPLGCTSRNDKSIFLEWDRLCKHLASCIPPERLRLCLICDVTDVKSAQEVIKPMRQLPVLSACSICFSTQTDDNLRCLAAKATQEMTGRGSSLPPSPRLPQLPFEIQIQILQYTDLVAPHDLRWAPEQGFICLSQSPHGKDSASAQNPQALNPCKSCSSVHNPRHHFNYQLRKTAFASQCQCWRFPIELFLVSSAYHREATRIFYSSNHFYVYGGVKHSLYNRDMCPRFIQQLPQDAPQYLRSLQFLIPRSIRWSKNDWKEDVFILSRKVDLSRLTVTIDESLWRHRDYSRGWGIAVSVESVRQHTLDIVTPFAKLGPLKDFFLHLGYPAKGLRAEELRNDREKWVERWIMGADYDSEERGKHLHRHRFYNPRFD